MSIVASPVVPLAGVLLALGGAVVFSVNDMAFKLLSGDYALYQVVMVRSVIGLVFLATLIAATGARFGQLRTQRTRRHALRVVVVLTSNATYFMGLAAMPLADAVALAFIAPVFITLLSIVMLGEKVGPHRWAAVATGLAGTVILMRPGSGAISPAAILILISAFGYALSQMMGRQMRDTESAITLSFWIHAGFLVMSAGMGLWAGDGRFSGSSDPSLAFLFRAWVWPALADWPLLLATGLSVAIGSLMITQAYRTCDAAVIASFEYAGIPMAIFWGAVMLGTFPDRQGFVGMGLIVAAGLYTLWRETRRRKDRT